MSSIKIRTRTENGITTVSTMIRHPMETGRRKDPVTGEVIHIHHITEVNCDVNGETVMHAIVGTGISKNPFFSFHLHNVNAGDILTLNWLDNLGYTDSVKTEIK